MQAVILSKLNSLGQSVNQRKDEPNINQKFNDINYLFSTLHILYISSFFNSVALKDTNDETRVKGRKNVYSILILSSLSDEIDKNYF